MQDVRCLLAAQRRCGAVAVDAANYTACVRPPGHRFVARFRGTRCNKYRTRQSVSTARVPVFLRFPPRARPISLPISIEIS